MILIFANNLMFLQEKNYKKNIFKGVNNQIVEFKTTNYQFPEISDCQYDFNWLLSTLNVKVNIGKY